MWHPRASARRLTRPLLAVGLLLLLSGQGEANRNPFEAEQARLAREVTRARGPRATLALIELWRSWGDVRPEIALGHLRRLAGDRRLPAPLRALATGMLARGELRTGEVEASRERLDALGVAQSWMVIGPFDNEGKAGFGRADPPEEAPRARADLGAAYPGRERAVRWRVQPPGSPFGRVAFDGMLRPRANVCGYAATYVESRRAQPLTLWVGGSGATKVWWNGELVHEDPRYREAAYPDRAAAAVGAHQGLNRVLVKSCVTEGNWGLFLRVGSAAGGSPSDIRIDGTPPIGDLGPVPAGHGARPGRAPTAPLAALEAAAARGGAADLEAYARYLAYTASDDPAEELAPQAAARAVREQPTVARLALATRLATRRGDQTQYATQAAELSPRGAASRLLRARVALEGPSPESALPLLEGLDPRTIDGMEGKLVEAEVYRSLGLPRTAYRAVVAAAEHAPGAPRWVGARAGAAAATERRDEAIRMWEAVLHGRWDDLGSRAALIDDALIRADREAALAHLAAYRTVGAARARAYLVASDVRRALGEPEEAFAAIQAGLDLAPEEPALHVAEGRLHLEQGRDAAAAASLQDALALRPQDASTRELLEQIQPEARADEAYAVAKEELLVRRADAGGYPLRLLAEVTVNTVYDNGLGSSFRQVAAHIQDDEGARRWRTFSIQYDPEVQRLDLRQARVLREDRVLSATQTFVQPLGEPWYRVYYNSQALVVVFPDLEPGDVVDLQWRIDDVAPRNLFDDYYGDLKILRGDVPIARLDYVSITPEGRPFYANEPTLPGLEHEQRVQGGRRLDHFHAEDIAPVPDEPDAPGPTELAPYLHVSTYRTWEEVGRWYWGLIQDQLRADDRLREVVRGLMRGASSTEEKVARIYDWVIRNTRYVALEFGIHGFLPYRVPDIVNRGFGDCKDKASLIYVMLEEAGIDARIVLVRTRRNGQIRDLPASLAVFDHAIAYVPELDLYLDGTAELTGYRELPSMDQGVTVLRVGPETAELGRIPESEAASNRRTRTLDVRLRDNGAATVRMTEELRGVEAPYSRSAFQSEGTRDERLERRLRELFPGLTLTNPRYGGLDDYNAPVTVEVTAEVPRLGVRDGRALRVTPSALAPLSRSLARTSDRRLPLDLGGRSSYRERRTVHPPPGWSVRDVPESSVAESPFGRLSLEVTRDGDAAVFDLALDLSEDRIAPDDYPAFREWVEAADRILRRRLILRAGAAQ